MSVLKINLSAREDNEICTSRFSKEIGAKFFMTSGLMSFDSVLLLKMAFLIGFSSPNPLKTELYLIKNFATKRKIGLCRSYCALRDTKIQSSKSNILFKAFKTPKTSLK